jgi:hypothetical protein
MGRDTPANCGGLTFSVRLLFAIEVLRRQKLRRKNQPRRQSVLVGVAVWVELRGLIGELGTTRASVPSSQIR